MVRHLTRHAVAVKVREKKNSKIPVKIALAILVAVIPTANITIENSDVPNMPARRTLSEVQQSLLFGAIVAVKSNIARYPIAIPRVTQRNAGVTVITPVI